MGTTTRVRTSDASSDVGPVDVTEDFASSYKATLGQLIAFFRAKGISIDESADLAHETLLRTLVHLKRHGRERADLGPLVRTIARNLLVERIRKARPAMVPLSEATDVANDEVDAFDHMLSADVEMPFAQRSATVTRTVTS